MSNQKILPNNIAFAHLWKIHGISGSRIRQVTSTYKAVGCLRGVFLELLRPTFMILSDSKLIERCVHGTTQNPNEYSNSMVWVLWPKYKNHSKRVIYCAAQPAVCHFHRGAESRIKIMDKLSIPAGNYTSHAFGLKDKKCVWKADLHASVKEKNDSRNFNWSTCNERKPFVKWRLQHKNMNLGASKCPSLTCDNTIQAYCPHYIIIPKYSPFILIS